MKRIASTIVLLLFLSFFVPSFLVFPANATEDSWMTMEPMPTARSGLGVAVVDGKIYAIGGHNGNSFLGTNEMYDPETDTWETRTSMPTPRSEASASVVNNKIYLIAGKAYTNKSVPYYNSVSVNEVYDPETDTWTTKTRMPDSAFGYASAVVENKIYLISGVHQIAGPFYPNPIADNRIYDAETDTWTYGKSILTLVINAASGATTGLLAPKRIYVIGGWNGWELGGSNMTQIYDPEKDEWILGSPMSIHRFGMGVAIVDDVLYVIGGSTGSGILGDDVTQLALNEQYTPAGYIPEFPSWIILPLFFVATIVGVAIKRKSFRPT